MEMEGRSMTDREAIKMAFDTLVNLTSIDEYGSKEEIIAKHKTMGMLRQALAQPEQAEYDKLTVKFGERAKEYLEAAKKSWQPEQEPVAYMGSAGLGYDKNKYLSIPLYTAPPKREWVGLTDETLDDVYFCVEGGTTPLETWREQARAIEAKLKEKNT